jgi:microsomal dipeptidase-like Zn-dependent dipeptidase
MDDEMKKLAEEYGIVKVDALNCIDCQLGGKGKFLEADPHHDLMFLSPGMTDFFSHAQKMMRKEGMDEVALKQFFSGLRGIIILGTLGNAAELKSKVERLNTGLLILETKAVGCDNVKNVIQEAIERNERRTR